MNKFGKTMGERMLEQMIVDQKRERRRALVFMAVALAMGAAMMKYLIFG